MREFEQTTLVGCKQVEGARQASIEKVGYLTHKVRVIRFTDVRYEAERSSFAVMVHPSA